MKQDTIIDRMVSSVLSLSNGGSLHIAGFHPDLFYPLIVGLNIKLFIRVSDNHFGLIIKYLSSFWDSGSVAFVGSTMVGAGSPPGFDGEALRLSRRSKELFADGIGGIRTIVCSSSGLSVPIVGSGDIERLSFSDGIGFENCLDFLIKEQYKCVDCVASPGEYNIKGGIIDVFPKTSLYPYRINFLDASASVSRFDIDSQLTVSKIKNFCLVSTSNEGLLSLRDICFDSFLKMELGSLNDLFVGTRSDAGDRIDLKTVTQRDFFLKSKNSFKAISICSSLSSIGVLDENNNLFVPGWFLDARLSIVNEENDVRGPIPLELLKINRGDFLVHRDHGVGVCAGLSLCLDHKEVQELLVIKYRDGGSVSVDVGRLDLVSFFAPAETEGVSLDSLSKQGSWLRKKVSAKKLADEMVRGLLKLYISRYDIFRVPFLSDPSMERDFLSRFPYKDTPDQILAWKDISDDLESNSPMDRLLCGDVGFGKTELAIRAAFRVVLSGRRVVVLAPTTILANQLYSSFSSRLNPFAISTDMVSRFKGQKEIRDIKIKITDRKNDVLIGTHSILNNDIYLKNIGLLVIDEEHRFGVKQKEKIKGCKNSVDVLSMSATPIPRSINLALSRIYSISMLQTPPLLRRPINTHVYYYNDNLIRSAIDFELGRGGQIYFIHNDISSIKSVVYRLRSFFPNYCVEFIHGQEPSINIELKMNSFVSGEVDVLVCTSIIESGIDVSSANSIIINQSHLFGLSQLYQMRGRVGRGSQQAYAYLLLPRNIHLSYKAHKRIKTIVKNTSLGSGYNVALSDMEIRGSGSLFGYRQSGGSGSVGYEMYTRLIQSSLRESVSSNLDFSINLEDVRVIFFLRRFVPENYVSSERVRMSIYKNLSVASDERGLDDLLYNIIDRFGPAPPPLINLVNEFRLRLKAASLGINSIFRSTCGVVCSFERCGENFVIASLLEHIKGFWDRTDTEFHILPSSSVVLHLCLHLLEDEYSYSLFSSFIDKFNALNKTN